MFTSLKNTLIFQKISGQLIFVWRASEEFSFSHIKMWGLLTELNGMNHFVQHVFGFFILGVNNFFVWDCCWIWSAAGCDVWRTSFQVSEALLHTSPNNMSFFVLLFLSEHSFKIFFSFLKICCLGRVLHKPFFYISTNSHVEERVFFCLFYQFNTPSMSIALPSTSDTGLHWWLFKGRNTLTLLHKDLAEKEKISREENETEITKRQQKLLQWRSTTKVWM